MMRYWTQVLHFYQPPTQKAEITHEVLDSCYLPLLETLLANPPAQVTLHLSGSLLEQVDMFGNHNFFEKIADLIQKGQIELLTSPSFHPLIPLTDKDSLERQFKRSGEILRKHFPNSALAGVYPPELGVDAKTLDLLKKYGQFTIVDQSGVNDWDFEEVLKEGVFDYKGLTMLASSRLITEIIRSYPENLNAQKFLDFFNSKTAAGQLVISVNDAELFGHHYRERLNFLREVYQSDQIEFLTCSQALDKFQPKSLSQINPSTWQTAKAEFDRGNSYPLWLNPINSLQKNYQNLSNFVVEAVKKAPVVVDSIFQEYAWMHLDRGTSSCNLFWLSNWPWWHPDLVQEGATELIKAVRTLPVDKTIKYEAEKRYHELVHEMWQFHWSGEVEKNWAKYNDYRQDFLKKLPNLT